MARTTLKRKEGAGGFGLPHRRCNYTATAIYMAHTAILTQGRCLDTGNRNEGVETPAFMLSQFSGRV
jgi:hypothetical protein